MSSDLDAHSIDLNADLAEGFGRWSFGTDDALLGIVSSANIACGFHAGDPSVIRHAVVRAASNGVRIGAHVGYPDLSGFGRRAMAIDQAELTDLVLYQIAALSGIARTEGTSVEYVKPHGALYNAVHEDAGQAAAVSEAVWQFDPKLAMLSMPGSAIHAAARDRNLRVEGEAFADRAYRNDGGLAPRRLKGAVLEDAELITVRTLRMLTEGMVTTIEDRDIRMRADSVCIHGDSPGAVEMARKLRSALTGAGFEIRAPGATTRSNVE